MKIMKNNFTCQMREQRALRYCSVSLFAALNIIMTKISHAAVLHGHFFINRVFTFEARIQNSCQGHPNKVANVPANRAP